MAEAHKVVDPDEGPVQAFAHELRTMRQKAGNPDYRSMARRVGSSASTLSTAAAGKKLPTLEATLAFVRSCRGTPADEARLAVLWKQASSQAAVARRPIELPGEGGGSIEVPVAASDGPRDGIRRRAALVLTGVAVLAAAAGAAVDAAVMPWQSPRAVATSVSPTDATVPEDGEDPSYAGCDPDAGVVASSPLELGAHQIGVLELHYSAHCQAGWARFYVGSDSDRALVEVRVESPDGRAAAFSYPAVVGKPVYTDLLHPLGGCLRAIVATTKGARVLTSVTPCLILPVRSGS